MSTGLRTSVLAGVLLLGLAGSPEALAQEKGKGKGKRTPGETITLTGRVGVVTQNSMGDVIEVCLRGTEKGAVLIAPVGRGTDLVDLVGERVVVTGSVRPSDKYADYPLVLRVTGYSVESKGVSPDDGSAPQRPAG